MKDEMDISDIRIENIYKNDLLSTEELKSRWIELINRLEKSVKN